MASLLAHQRQVSELLNVVTNRLALLLYGREEFVHGYLSVILIKTRKKLSFQVDLRIDRARRKASEPVECYPLQGANEQSGHDSIIVYDITGLRPEVVDVLVWRALTIIVGGLNFDGYSTESHSKG